MDQTQKSTYIQAQCIMCILEMQVKESENAERRRNALPPAHGPTEWKAMKEKWEPVLGENALTAFFSDENRPSQTPP